MSTASPTYRFVMAVSTPPVKWWGRLQVEGLEHLPTSGPTLLAGNHDSYWDPIAIGLAGLSRRQICALAKSSLWKPGLGKVLDGMGQIPIERGKGDAHAMDRAIEELRAGRCIGVFPEGTRSLGRTLRARSGFGRLADAVPEAQLVCCTVEGTVDIPKFPKSRPRVKVRFFAPSGGQRRDGESATELSARLLEEIRSHAPIRQAGRRDKPIPPMPEDRRPAATPGSSSDGAAAPEPAPSPPGARG
jgi:1-acyl-sn-glycerol-3-phosphate acyltransferase